MPAGILPTGGGMVCYGGGGGLVPANPPTWSRTNFANYVDCVAYGTYAGPPNILTGTPTPLNGDGHSLQRSTSTFNNAADFGCGDPATPQNNASMTVSLPATTPCVKTDDFQCFKAKDTTKAFVKTSKTVTDTYAGAAARAFKKPFLLCDSASIAGSAQTTPAARLSCYKVKGAKLTTAATKTVTDDFEHALRAFRRCSSFAIQRRRRDRALLDCRRIHEGGRVQKDPAPFPLRAICSPPAPDACPGCALAPDPACVNSFGKGTLLVKDAPAGEQKLLPSSSAVRC